MNISIFGLGYVGSVTAACLTQNNHRVIGVDVYESKVEAFRKGEAPIVEPELDTLLSNAKTAGNLDATQSVIEAIKETSLSIICVGTPSLQNGRLNLDYVREVSNQIAEAIRAAEKDHHVLVFRSTMLPGSTRSIIREFFDELISEGKVVALYAPEFLREGTAVADFRNPSLSVIGTSDGNPPEDATLLELLGGVPDVLKWEEAEMIKYSCNAFHATKVAFANEIGRLAKNTGLDGAKIMDVLCKDDKLNISKYYMKPGNPFGGSCLPKDVSALKSFARQEGVSLPLLESLVSSNDNHLDSLLKLVEKTGIRHVAILGLAFKSDTDDLRNSPMVAVAETLLGKGFQLDVYDPSLNVANLIGSNERIISRTLPHLAKLLKHTPAEALAEAKLVVVAQRCVPIETLNQLLSAQHHVIDVNGWDELRTTDASYEGSCW